MRDPRCKDDLFKSVSEFKDVYQTLLKTSGTNQTSAERRVGSQTSSQTARGGGGRGGRGRGGRYQGRGGRDSNGCFQRGGGGRGGNGNGSGSGGGRYLGGGRGGTNRSNNFISQATLNLLNPRERAMIMAGRASFEADDASTGSTRSVAAATAAVAAEPASNNTTSLVVTAPRTGTGASGMFGQNSGGNRNASSTSSASTSTTANQYYIDHDNVCRLCPVIVASARRHVGAQLNFQQPSDYSARKRCEIDTRADTFCAGQTFIFHEPTGSVVDVGGFHPSLPIMRDIPIGLAATAYDLPTGETIILGVHQALYFGASLENSLCQPNQLREHGIIVDDCPKQYSGGKSLHGLFFPEENVHIPLEMYGCLSYFPSRLPMQVELATCRWVHLSGEGEWEPYSDHFAAAESATKSHLTEHPLHPIPGHHSFDVTGNDLDGRYISAAFESGCIDCLIGNLPQEPTTVGNRFIGATSSRTHRSNVDAPELARRWGTSLSTAETTLKTTTQRGYRYLHGLLDRRFRTRQTQLRRTLLQTAVYSDTLFSDTKSIRGYNCAQLFVTAEGFADGNVMSTKADAYIQLNNFCREHGIPDPLVTDMAPEETEGEWKRVVKENLIHQWTTKAYSPWQNKCENAVGELKRHCMRISHRQRVPENLWCFTWKYTVKICQHISRETSGGQTPWESLKGETPDISALIEFDFYDFVKVQLLTGFPNDNWVLAQWLGPADGIGQELTYYVIKANGQVVARSTMRPLLPEEWTSDVEKRAREEFDKQLTEHIGAFDENHIQIIANDEMEEPIGMEADDDVADATNKARITTNRPANDVTAGPDTLVGAEIF
jgi:hypothetical protein